MNIVQWIRSILFSAQATVMLPVIGLLYAPWAMVSKRGAYAGCRAYARWVIWSAGWMINLRCEVRGTPPDMGCLVAAKHQSFLDILMIYNALPAAKFIMKSQLRYSPFLGQYAVKMQMVFVDRGKRGAAINKMLADVRAGDREPGQLVIYPQGTRSAPGTVMPYKVGTAILYEQLKQPCYPVATNAGVFWPRRGLYRRAGVAVVDFLPPISPGMGRDAFVATLEKQIEAASTKLLEETGVGHLYGPN
ncbi:lysophospholipid acyltransferase family protein [Sulfitobacter guttiformis]|uniref:1-acyl-sn-glycerol-3-phosphate acyltransferase n=1 Tax=Sulfitobacter guttiformis TaxID=74349 RepID=A0A420DUK4_9RHOB|nr:lysophospholipid acyltransferase family protein [Sulfitobacter guttiformis]KIN71349.1 Acyltransferase [Sulfitobacter guttiformis KCTC 32187]RKE97797.1 1-acyl-sn-glycerol-3-phosphate acyltransferase [Sulfitobacter guttiformis]